MLLVQYILILFIMILINSISTFKWRSKSTTIQSIYKITTDENQLKIDNEKLEKEKKQTVKSIKNTDVIQLNVGGEIMMTTRETLTRCPKSILAMMFNGHWENKLSMDKNGNIFLDFNPILFRHLLNQLQILDKNNLIQFHSPSEPSLIEPFKKMLRKLNLNQFLSLQNNIITFNVGGQIITNQHKTFDQVPNSTFNNMVSTSKITKFDTKSNVFIDYDPKLFRHLVEQLREKSYKNICNSVLSLNEEKSSFKNMIYDLNICQQIISSNPINNNTKWKQNGYTIAGGNGRGNQLNQLNSPLGIYVDDDYQSIYIADYENHRIMEWKNTAKNGQIIAGGNGKGNRTDQLHYPTHVVVDKKDDSIIICDSRNRRVVRWSRRNNTDRQIIISDIDCSGVTLDDNGNLYVANEKKNEVRRWKKEDKKGTVVVGGNSRGHNLNQLNEPSSIFVDQDRSIYVSDCFNHRVMKWMKDAKEGIVVAGVQSSGNNLTQLSFPNGLIVKDSSDIYIADVNNHRIMRWLKQSKQGSIIVGGNGEGEQQNQLNYPTSLSFDQQGNLYVVDHYNNRVQKFDIDSS